MTINGGKPHAVGDRGQRYEVRCTDPEKKQGSDDLGAEMIIGWCRTLHSVRSLVAGIKLHPAWHTPHVIDRTTGEDVPLDELERRQSPRS